MIGARVGHPASRTRYAINEGGHDATDFDHRGRRCRVPILFDPAWAFANRTFVSGLRSDTNPCTLAAPCRSFAQALTQTNAGGEITVLDSAGYGSVTISQAISIVAPDGIEGGITVTSGDAITINAGTSDIVNLRGLTLVGGGVGVDGIHFTSGGGLNIRNCTIGGFTNYGMHLAPSGSTLFNINDTFVSDSGKNVIYLVPTASGATDIAVFERTQSSASGIDGFRVDGLS
jgi:hypothetical protein